MLQRGAANGPHNAQLATNHLRGIPKIPQRGGLSRATMASANTAHSSVPMTASASVNISFPLFRLQEHPAAGILLVPGVDRLEERTHRRLRTTPVSRVIRMSDHDMEVVRPLRSHAHSILIRSPRDYA